MKLLALDVNINSDGLCTLSLVGANADLDITRHKTIQYPAGGSMCCSSSVCPVALALNVELHGRCDVSIATEDLSTAHMSWPPAGKAAPPPPDISDSLLPSGDTVEPVETRAHRTCDVSKFSRRNRVDLLTRLEELEKGHAEPAPELAPLDVESSKAVPAAKERPRGSARGSAAGAKSGGAAKKPPKKPPANKRSGGRGVFGGHRMAKVH